MIFVINVSFWPTQWLLLQTYSCYLSLVLWCRDTYNIVVILWAIFSSKWTQTQKTLSRWITLSTRSALNHACVPWEVNPAHLNALVCHETRVFWIVCIVMINIVIITVVCLVISVQLCSSVSDMFNVTENLKTGNRLHTRTRTLSRPLVLINIHN